MKKFLILLLAAVFLFSASTLNSKTGAETNRTTLDNPALTSTPKPQVEIEKFELDKTESLYICPYFQLPNACGRDENGKEISQLINVETTVRNPQNYKLVYIYIVSGGTITGAGKKVVWDLTKTRPGRSYTIMVAVTDEKGFLYQTRSANAAVRECDCHIPCVCPTVDAFGGGNVKAGENVTFSAEVAGGTVTDITYNWTVSQGEIVEGQGTPKITVRTTKEMTGIIKATVEIDGVGPCELCLRTAQETAMIIK